MRRSEMPASARQRDGQKVELEGQRLAVKIAAGDDLVAEHQRIVGGGVQLDREDAPRLGQRVAHRAVDLRRAAQRVGILHAPAGDVRLRGSRCLRAGAAGARRWPAGRDAGARRAIRWSKARGVPRSASSVRAQTTSAVSASISAAASSRQPIASMACVPLISEMPSLGCSSSGSMPARAQRLAARHARAAELRLAFADQHQRHVRQRREVARRAHAALRRHHRRDAAIQQLAQALGHQRADARRSLSPARWRGSASWRAPRRAPADRRRRRQCERTTLRCSCSRSSRGMRTSASRPTPVLTP